MECVEEVEDEFADQKKSTRITSQLTRISANSTSTLNMMAIKASTNQQTSKPERSSEMTVLAEMKKKLCIKNSEQYRAGMNGCLSGTCWETGSHHINEVLMAM